MRRGRVESALFDAVGLFELVALRARRRCGLSDATGIRGIGGRGAENEISKVAPHHSSKIISRLLLLLSVYESAFLFLFPFINSQSL